MFELATLYARYLVNTGLTDSIQTFHDGFGYQKRAGTVFTITLPRSWSSLNTGAGLMRITLTIETPRPPRRRTTWPAPTPSRARPHPSRC